MSLSTRGIKASQSSTRVDLEMFGEAIENLYDLLDNPSGTFPMNIAENRLNWKMLKEKFQAIQRSQDIPDWVPSYEMPNGAEVFRTAIANFMKTFLCGCEVRPEHLAVSSGASAVVEVSSFIIAEPGDVAVFPAPCYPVYKSDIGRAPY